MNTDQHPSPLPGRTWNGYFRQRVVYAWELPALMRKHIYTGALGNIWASLITGIFFVHFGTEMGISRLGWSLMAGISSWLLAAQLLSAALTERLGNRKAIWFAFCCSDRVLRLVGILAAYGLWHAGSSHAALVLIVTVCAANFMGTMATPPWLSWLADIIPEEKHGSFWGRRVAWVSLSVISVVVPAGFVIDRVPAASKVGLLTVLFTAATVVGVIDLVIHGTIPEPSMLVPGSGSLRHRILVPLRDRDFCPWLGFNLCWTFAMTLGGTLATLYFVTELDIKSNFLGGSLVITAATLLGSTLTGHWSGRLVDRLGVRRVLMRGHLCWAFLPAFWIFATPRTALFWLGLGSFLGGTSSTAAINAATKLITRFNRLGDCAMYVAVSSSLASLAGGLGVMTAGVVLHRVGDWHCQVGSWRVCGFHLLFGASLVLRLAAAVLLIPRIRESAGRMPGMPEQRRAERDRKAGVAGGMACGRV